MKKEYEVTMDGKTIGEVFVTRTGLYLQIACRCRLADRQVCRLYACQGDRQEKLGVLVPDGDVFCLQTKIPVKRMEEGQWQFQVRAPAGKDAQNAVFLPVSPGQPFEFIEELKNACFAVQDDRPGVWIQVPDESVAVRAAGAHTRVDGLTGSEISFG